MKRLVGFTLILLAALSLTALYLSWRRHVAASSITLFGNVDVRQVDLNFNVQGRVADMPFQEGDYVPKGALVATLDPQLYVDLVLQAQANLESAKASLKNAETILKRRDALLADGAISKEDYENAQSSRDIAYARVKETKAALGVAQTNLGDSRTYAPANGTILTRVREPGTIVKVGEAVYTLSLTDPVWVRAFISEPNLGRIFPGMPAEIHTDTIGAPVYKGHIGFISPVAEFTPKNVETTELRTDLVYRLRIIVDNPDRGLRQGMPVTVKLKEEL